MKLGVLCAAAALALSASSASAAMITQKNSFTAYDFQAYWGPLPAPTDPLAGAFLVTYDPDIQQDPTSAGIEVLSLNIADPGATFSTFYTPPLGTSSLAIGTRTTPGSGFAILGIGDYGVLIGGLGSTPRMVYAQYYAPNGGNYYTSTGGVTVTTVPEPQTWALLIAGFGLTGASLRRRRVAAAAICS